MKKTLLTLMVICLCAGGAIAQQVTRGQVLKAMYRSEALHSQGKDSMAIALLDSMATLLPRLSVIYEREGRIYESMYNKSNDPTALNAAVLMYRKFLSMELNENKTREASQKLRALEDRLQIAHFEDQEEEEARKEEASALVLPTIVDDSQAMMLAEEEILLPDFDKKPSRRIEHKDVALAAKQEEVKTETTARATAADLPAVAEQKLAAVKQEGPFSYLTYYELQVPTLPEIHKDKESVNITNEDLEGHWVSSLANSDGRERWIFDIAPFDNNSAVQLHPEAGILNDVAESRKFYDRVVNFMKENEILSNTTLSIPCDQVLGTISGSQMSFNLESEKTYKPNSSIYSWGHTLLDNVSTLLPFGQMVYKIGDKMLTKQEDKDLESVFTTEMKFTLNKVGEGVMRVNYTGREKKTNKKGSKLIKNSMESFFLFRTTTDYVHFEPIETEELEDDHSELFAQVNSDAQRDPSKILALATMYFYGAGTEANESLALKMLNQQAQRTDSEEIYAWLAKFYYNEAYENQSLSSSSRKKYLKASRYNLNKLAQKHSTEWYGIMGDMYENETGADADSAFYYYQQGAMKGDAYSLYKLGTCYVNANHTTRDFTKGRNYLNQSAKKGNADAYLALARMDKAGAGGAQNLTSYLQNLSKAIDLGSVEAIHELSDAYMQGVAVKRDFHQATLIRDCWYRAQQNGWIDAVLKAGYSL
ncbi:MAG: sel1 repeat family protein [Bacteroidales bacterium]|nr:sel1 repeat family protein [Candidatus Liminaster caballi]